ncbi:MAG: hypothetical protein K0U98_27280 [Deltaproteobacteria bacterium]|nr:hypothetical protein [Deltaproteobacteria bacterium]
MTSPPFLAPSAAATLLVAMLGFTLACTSETPTPSKDMEPSAQEIELPLGIWQRIPGEGTESAPDWETVLAIFPDELIWASPQKVHRVSPIIELGETFILASSWGDRLHIKTELKEDRTLQLSWTSTVTPFQLEANEKNYRYRRLNRRPACLDTDPLPIPTPTALEPLQLSNLQQELLARGERDQEVRAFAQSDQPITPEHLAEMRQVDQDNTSWIKEVISRVGWIDSERFGKEASSKAFLLVQHSGDLPLMQGVLPLILLDVEAGRQSGQYYALLYDRTELNLGRLQRYGSQLSWNQDGPYVAPLEDPSKVDERRAALGMSTLVDYVSFAASQGSDGNTMPPVLSHF